VAAVATIRNAPHILGIPIMGDGEFEILNFIPVMGIRFRHHRLIPLIEDISMTGSTGSGFFEFRVFVCTNQVVPVREIALTEYKSRNKYA
jgi:hypothetical protein